MFTTQTPPGARSRHALPLAWLGALLWATAYPPVSAQSTAPNAAQADAQQRSQRQSDNVYRWIKLHAEPIRKAPPPRARPKTDTATLPHSKPEVGSIDMSIEQAQAETTTGADQPLTSVAAVSAASMPPSEALPPAPVATAEEPLKPVAQPQPEFPRDLRNTLSQGKVMLAFTVQPDGSVSAPSVLNTSNRKLSRPALEAVSRWRFEPIRVARAAQVEIAFDLQ